MDYFAESYLPEIFCLLAQTSLALVAILKIRDNRYDFPIKQFGPVATITAIICFLLCSVFNLVGRLIEDYL